MLNENIKALRKTKGLSQEELAIKLNVVRQTISKWEKGLSVPDAGMLMKIADALDTTVNALLSEEVPKAEEQESTKDIAAKLELLNEQYAKRNERNRKLWRLVFTVIGIIAIAGIVAELLTVCQLIHVNASTQIIGGADIATQIYIMKNTPHGLVLFITVIACIAAIIGIHYTKKK